jgi:2-polyprenyl-3-methyl-5-hydroxy-6-metoxy-1,4-benzoquinol methylase
MSIMIKEAEHGVEFEIIACPLCGNENYQEQYSFSDTRGSFAIVVCTHCQLQFLNPRPTELTIGDYYNAAEYTPFLSSGNNAGLFSKAYSLVRKWSVRWKRKRVESCRRKGSVLDVGCGTGEFLSEMTSHGWEGAGLEPSPEASEFARRRFNLKIETGTVGEAGLKKFHGTFDVITLWHVLEHVHHPKEAMEQIKGLLNDDGWLIIAVPNISSYDASVYQKDWVALDPPRHLFHYTAHTMEKLMSESGFRIHRKHQMPLDAVFNCLMSEKNKGVRILLFPFHLLHVAWTLVLSLILGLKSEKGSAILYYIRKI